MSLGICAAGEDSGIEYYRKGRSTATACLQSMNDRSQIILLIEDSPDDVFFLRHALQKARMLGTVHVVTDGQQALDYLQGIGKYADRVAFPLPTVIFLDLKLPLVSGFDVLA